MAKALPMEYFGFMLKVHPEVSIQYVNASPTAERMMKKALNKVKEESPCNCIEGVFPTLERKNI